MHGVEEPVHGHEEQVEEVDGGALDHPVDPGGEVVTPDDARVKGARNARSYIRTETLFRVQIILSMTFRILILPKTRPSHSQIYLCPNYV